MGEKKTVEALARQFQDQIERILTEKVSSLSIMGGLTCFLQGQVEKSYLPSRQEQEVEEFRKLHREKSFDEARTAVQSQVEILAPNVTQCHTMSHNVTQCLQIERMFLKAAADEPAPPGMSRLQSSFVQNHNVTHILQVQDARHLPPRPRGRDGSSPPNPPRHPSSDRSSSTRGKGARRACAGVSSSFNGEHHPRA